MPAPGVLHFWWLVKADVREPLLYAALLALLLLGRNPHLQTFYREVRAGR